MFPEANTALFVSSNEHDIRFLRNIFHRHAWELVSARCCADARRLLASRSFGVVIGDSELPDGASWKDLLRDIEKLRDPPGLVVISRLADERLWAEVLNLGGYDVLAKPFEDFDVTHVIGSAFGQLARAQSGRC